MVTKARTTESKPATRGKEIVQEREQQQAKMRAAAEQTMFARMEAPKPLSVLELANNAVNGDRQENYGDQLRNFTNIADIWTVLLRNKLIDPLTPQEVAMCMAGLKLARLTKTGGLHRDSIIDLAGYAECLDKVNKAQYGGPGIGTMAACDARNSATCCDKVPASNAVQLKR